MNSLKKALRKLAPEPFIVFYHTIIAQIATWYYGHPTKDLFVIGITGTKGKTSSANYVWSVLTAGGFKTGQIGTANIRIADKEFLNEYHMTMPSPFVLQKLFRQMVKAGCTHVVLEVTSEGLKLNRHIGIDFDVAVFTNLSPEHLPSHGGSFEKYKEAKGKLFGGLRNGGVIIANNDDENKDYFLNFPARLHLTYGANEGSDWRAEKITETNTGIEFMVKGESYRLSMLGKFNVYNALPAMVIANAVLQINNQRIRRGLENLAVIPGRMEKIDAGQNFTVIVDYAHEKLSMNAVMDAAKNMSLSHNIIVLLGAEGGGRDKNKRFEMGKIVAEKADYVICSNVDPYDDDPTEIVEDIARTCEQNGKIRNQNLFVIEDRREGIRKALTLAQPGDVVVITGKGAEQSMIVKEKQISWDDRKIVREELQQLLRK